MTGNGIRQILKQIMPNAQYYFRFKEYICLSCFYITNKLLNRFRMHLLFIKLNNLFSSSNISEHATRFRIFSMDKSNIILSKDKGVCIGEMWYKDNNEKEKHINIAIGEDNAILYIDPETSKIINLSYQERASCNYIRF